MIVIAILAAVSVVTYSHVTAKAKETKLIATTSNLEKKVKAKQIVDSKASPSITATSVE